MASTEAYRSLCSRATLQNKAEGCFFDLAENFGNQINPYEFACCVTDLQRISFCASRFWNSIGVELIFRGKDASEGTRFRLEGNNEFESGDFQKALLLYSKSVIRTPISKELGVVFANRSAVLYRLKEWLMAIEDAKLAMTYNYPENKRYELYERMTSCYLHLKNYKFAKVTIGLAEHFSSKYNYTAKNLKKKLEKMKNEIESATKASVAEVQEAKAMSSENKMFPCASKAFGVKIGEKEGRYAFATNEIAAGEEILVEKPFAACLLPERNGTNCHHCMQRLRISYPCELCAYVAYCSTACRDHAKVYHQFECKIQLLLVGSGMSVLPLLAFRIITQQSREELLKEYENMKVFSDEVLTRNGVYESTSYRTVFNLVGHENQRDPIDFFQRTIMALFLLKALRLVGYFKVNIFTTPEPTEDELRIGSLLLRNLQVLQFNAYEIVEQNLPPNTPCSKLRLTPIGLGIYTTAAFLNHSCAPNVVRHFVGPELHVTAIRNIPMQDAIEDNYGPMFSKVKIEERQRTLMGRYWFQCCCCACRLNWKTLKEREVNAEATITTNNVQVALELMESGAPNAAKTRLVEELRNIPRDDTSKLSEPKTAVMMTEEAFRIAVISSQH